MDANVRCINNSFAETNVSHNGILFHSETILNLLDCGVNAYQKHFFFTVVGSVSCHGECNASHRTQ